MNYQTLYQKKCDYCFEQFETKKEDELYCDTCRELTEKARFCKDNNDRIGYKKYRSQLVKRYKPRKPP